MLMFLLLILSLFRVVFCLILKHSVSLFSNQSKSDVCVWWFQEQQQSSNIFGNTIHKAMTTFIQGVIKHTKWSGIGCARGRKKLHPPSYIDWRVANWFMFVPKMTNIYPSACLQCRVHFSLRQPCFSKHSFNHWQQFRVNHTRIQRRIRKKRHTHTHAFAKTKPYKKLKLWSN